MVYKMHSLKIVFIYASIFYLLRIKKMFFLLLVYSTEFKEGIEKLADLLNISKHPDHINTLKAIHTFVTTRLSTEAIKNPSIVIPKVNIIINFLQILFLI